MVPCEITAFPNMLFKKKKKKIAAGKKVYDTLIPIAVNFLLATLASLEQESTVLD